MVSRGHAAFEIDLGPCTSMDSTFLGVLVGLSMKLEKAGSPKPIIYRAAPCTYDLFKTLGVERFFCLNSAGMLMTGPATEFDAIDSKACTKSEWANTMINAHQLLVEVDDRNGPRFQDLLDYMKADMASKHGSIAASDPAPGSRTNSRWKH